MRSISYLRYFSGRMDPDDISLFREDIILKSREKYRQNLMMSQKAKNEVERLMGYPSYIRFDLESQKFVRTPEGKFMDAIGEILDRFWTEEV